MSAIRARFLRTTCIALAMVLPGTAFAGTVSGVVTDGSGTRSLQGAQLRIVELNRVAEAARDGTFRFPDVPAGTYTLEAAYVGANTTTQSFGVDEGGDATVNVTLGDKGEILVVGQWANLSSSLSRQRAADGVESVLTRDAVGQFPDQNVAESLRRLPGINILNDQGEGRFVSVRGLDPELNAASVNGVRLPAPESDTRQVALDVISSDLIESIEVKKSLTPDMDADTIGASIEINTTSAFDRKKDLLAVKLEGSYNDLTEALTPKASIDFSTKLGDNVGVAGGISYYKRKFATNNQEADGWDESDGIVYADTLEFRDYDVERERISASLSFDFRVGDSTKLYARGLWSQFDDQEYRRRLIFEIEEGPSGGTGTSASFSSEDEDQEISVQRDLKDRFERQRVQSLVLGGTTESDGFKATYSASWSKSTEKENGSIDPASFERVFENGDNFGVDFDYSRDKHIPYTITSGADAFFDPSEYELDKVERTTISNAKDEEWAAKLDLSKKFAMSGGEFTIQAGGKARWRKKSYDTDRDIFEWDGDGDLTLAQAGLLGRQDYDLGNIEPALSKNGFRGFVNSNLGSFAIDDGDTFEESNVSDYSVKEDIIAGYMLGRWDSATLRVIGGVRMEHTKNKIFGKEVDLDTQTFSALAYKRSYTDWLPSLTVRYEPTRDVVLRLGGYKSLVRPKLSNLAPNVVIEDDEGEAGNPFLKPYSAWNLDLSAEYYFSQNGGITLGFFYKDIKDYVVEQTESDVTFNGIALDELTTFINGDKAKVKGIEFSYNQAYTFLPAPFDGLLTQVNYTYTDAKGTVLTDGDIGDPRSIPLPSSSKHTFNVVLGYEKGPLSLRAAGTYRSKYLDEVAGVAEEDRYVASHFQLDLSAKYRILPGVRIFAEWINITDAPYFAYQNFGGNRRLLQYEDYSWTAKFGVSANF